MALAGREAGLFSDIVGYGRNEGALRRAQEARLIDRIAASPAEAVAGAEVVVIAVPLGAVPTLLDGAAPALAPGALLVDVGSVKAEVVDQIEARLPGGVEFVGCHPLAGTERFGPAAATPDLFRGRPCIVCPTNQTSQAALRRAHDLWVALGAEVVEMGSAEHDGLMAAASHLPHVAAYALARVVGETTGPSPDLIRRLRLTSLRDTTRVAASSPEMWRDILAANRPALLPLVDDLIARLGELREAIGGGDAARIHAFLEGGRAARTRLFPP